MGSRVRLTGLVALALLVAGAAPVRLPKPPTDAEFKEQIERLGPKHDKQARLSALGWINRNSQAGNAALAVVALGKCVRDDPEEAVRQWAVNVLGQIARGQCKPCPLVLFEALHDKADFVRYQAAVSIYTFKTYTPGAADVLLRGMTAENPEVRSSCLLLLGRVAGKEPKALAAMEKAKADKVFDVRHSAHLARFIANDKLDEYLPYLIRVLEDPDDVLRPVSKDPEVVRRERIERNLVVLGVGQQMIEWGEARTDELARLLLKLLKDKSAVQRRGAANRIAAAAVKVEQPAKQEGASSNLWRLLPNGDTPRYTIPSDGEKKAPAKKETKPAPVPPREKSKLALRLEKLGVEATLRELREGDPDRTVRDAARGALERLASVKEKQTSR